MWLDFDFDLQTRFFKYCFSAKMETLELQRDNVLNQCDLYRGPPN
jgi:hypothetical protein